MHSLLLQRCSLSFSWKVSLYRACTLKIDSKTLRHLLSSNSTFQPNIFNTRFSLRKLSVFLSHAFEFLLKNFVKGTRKLKEIEKYSWRTFQIAGKLQFECISKAIETTNEKKNKRKIKSWIDFKNADWEIVLSVIPSIFLLFVNIYFMIKFVDNN